MYIDRPRLADGRIRARTFLNDATEYRTQHHVVLPRGGCREAHYPRGRHVYRLRGY
jgi:hypothetical protein